MKTEETIYQTEETKITTNNGGATSASNVIMTPEKKEDKETPKSNNTWMKVAIGGVAGIAFGGAGVFAAEKFNLVDKIMDVVNPNGEESDMIAENLSVEETTSQESAYSFDDQLKVAQTSDSMSFGEAFAEAREQVGPGGVFEWNGGVYGTFYAEEWDGMSSDEKAEFGTQVAYLGSRGSSNDLDAVIDIAEDVTVEVESDVILAEVETSNDILEDGEVQVLGVTEEVLADGSIVTVGLVESNGQEVFLIDTDQDGVFDIAFNDANKDGNIDEGECISIEDRDLASEVDVYESAAAGDDYLAEADYANEDINLV